MLSDLEKSKITSLYVNGKSIYYISNKIGKSFGACRKVLLENDIQIRTLSEATSNRYKLPSYKIKDIVRMYNAGKNISEIAKDICCGTKTISDVLKKYDVVFRKPNKKYTVNEKYFLKINSSDKAYWIGFILADGCILGNNSVLQISLKISDYDHLDLFNNCIASDYPIKHVLCGKGFSQSKLSISSKDFVEHIVNIGIGKRKSFTSKTPNIKNKFIKDFWRGVFDGDGWIFKSSSRNEWHVGLCGTLDIVSDFKKFVADGICYNYDKKISETGSAGIYKVNYIGKQLPFRVIDLLYGESDIRLERKNKLYIDLRSEVET